MGQTEITERGSSDGQRLNDDLSLDHVFGASASSGAQREGRGAMVIMGGKTH